MSDEYVLQITYQGVDEKGRTVMLNVRGNSTDQFDKMRAHVAADINALKPLPVKQYGGGNPAQKKQIVYLPDAPKCPKHQKQMTVREWTSPEGKVLHFWSCGEKDSNGWCREKVTPNPTPEQVTKWRELNGIEAPKAEDDPTICKIHNVKMSEVSPKSGKPLHRITLDDGTPGFCNGVIVASGKPATKAAA